MVKVFHWQRQLQHNSMTCIIFIFADIIDSAPIV